MNPTSSLHTVYPDVAASFWPSIDPYDRSDGHARLQMGAASNLYELFEQKLSLLVAGACEADRVAHVLFTALAPEQITSRRLVLGLAKSARGCLPALPHALCDEGLVLPQARDIANHVLLLPINPARRGPRSAEPRSVAGARMVDAFTHGALHFEVEAEHAADDAWLLGSDGLPTRSPAGPRCGATASMISGGVRRSSACRRMPRISNPAHAGKLRRAKIWRDASAVALGFTQIRSSRFQAPTVPREI